MRVWEVNVQVVWAGEGQDKTLEQWEGSSIHIQMLHSGKNIDALLEEL